MLLLSYTVIIVLLLFFTAIHYKAINYQLFLALVTALTFIAFYQNKKMIITIIKLG